jgi:hypothetical protein
MNLERNLHRAFAPREPAPQFEDLVMARVSLAAQRPGRRMGRPILYGTIVVASAAAAMLASGLMDRAASQSDLARSSQQHTDDASASLSRPLDSTSGLSQAAPAAEEVSAVVNALQIEVSSALVTVRVALPDPPPPERADMRAALEDPAVQQVLKSLQAALVSELRRVPGLAVVDKDPTKIDSASRHYRLGIAPDLSTGLDGRTARWKHGYLVTLTAVELQPGGKNTERLYTWALIGVDSIAVCPGVPPVKDLPCPPVTEAAAKMVLELRQEVLPPGASVTRPLQVRIADPLLAPEERYNSFAELVKQQAKTGGRKLLADKDVVSAVVELAPRVSPVRRAELWRAMRGVGDVLLVEPLLVSLQLDSEEVRIAALETLAADFRDDRRVRLALEAAAAADQRPLVRAVAQRALTGEEGWRAYVASTLKNPALPDSQRVEALMYELYPPDTLEDPSDESRARYWQVLEGLDDAAVRALVEIFPRAEVFRRWPANNLLANFASRNARNPAIIDLLLHVLANDSRALNRSTAAQTLTFIRRNDPRVVEALNEAVSSDPDTAVREDIRQMMERKAQ